MRPLRFSRAGKREVGPLAFLLLASALVLTFCWLAEGVRKGATERLDRTVLLAFRNVDDLTDPIGPSWVEETVRDITALGSFAFLGIVYAVVVGYVLLMRKPAFAVLISAAVLGGTVLSTGLKMAVERPRPDIPSAARVFTASFPSGHATVSAITFLTLGALLARTNPDKRIKLYIGGLAVTLTIMVGVSRIYIGVHYPSDVLAGWCLGAAWAILCWTAALRLQIQRAVET